MSLRLILIFTLISSVSFSQKTGILKGIITEARTGSTLFGATIQISNEMSKGTKSDIEGNYFLELDSGSYKLTCGFLGLGSDTFSISIFPGQVSVRNIQLNDISQLLETVVVSAGKFEQKLEEQVVSMEILKPAMIANRNKTSIETA
jgi:hypothetical protein